MVAFTEYIGDLIGGNKIEQAIEELSSLLKNSPKLNELIMHKARYNELKDQIRLGIIEYEQVNITKNKIRLSILELLNDIEDIFLNNQDVKDEFEKMKLNTPISNFKQRINGDNNIVTANGDINIKY